MHWNQSAGLLHLAVDATRSKLNSNIGVATIYVA